MRMDNSNRLIEDPVYGAASQLMDRVNQVDRGTRRNEHGPTEHLVFVIDHPARDVYEYLGLWVKREPPFLWSLRVFDGLELSQEKPNTPWPGAADALATINALRAAWHLPQAPQG